MTESVIKKSDKWIPWYFVAFFVVLAILDGIFVYIATSTHTGLVTDNAYKKGLAYNQTIENYEAQKQLGWQTDIKLEQQDLTFAIKDAKGNAIEDADVVAHISRVTQAGHDFDVSLQYAENGIYKNNVDFPMKGQWDVSVVVKWKQEQYQQSKRIIVK